MTIWVSEAYMKSLEDIDESVEEYKAILGRMLMGIYYGGWLVILTNKMSENTVQAHPKKIVNSK